MIDRSIYPINEPVFPHWANLGIEKETEHREFMNNNPSSSVWDSYNHSTDLININFARWRYMEIKIATKVDQDKRECGWCKNNPFMKGDIVIREQVSQQDFDTLHPACAQQKLLAIKENLLNGIDKLDQMIYHCHGLQMSTVRRITQ
jgi:hypothetical protein